MGGCCLFLNSLWVFVLANRARVQDVASYYGCVVGLNTDVEQGSLIKSCWRVARSDNQAMADTTICKERGEMSFRCERRDFKSWDEGPSWLVGPLSIDDVAQIRLFPLAGL